MQSKKGTAEILKILDEKYGSVDTFLNHSSPFQLLLAVILSAQTTDALVNKITPELFAKYPDARSLKNANLEDVEKLVSKVNYYRTKARNLIKTAKMIDEDFKGEIPNNIADLIKLAGVGRKVANVIVSEIFKIPEGVVVDTHIKRTSFRIGWTNSKNPDIIERDLMKVWPKEKYLNTPRQLILIGRNYCFARKPNCPECPLREWCEKRI